MKTLTTISKPDIFINKVNYCLLLTALSLIVLGFALMSGGKTRTPEVFNVEVFSMLRITAAPICIVLGYVLQFWAIMYYKKINVK